MGTRLSDDVHRRVSELLDKSLTNTEPYFISGVAAVTGLNGYCIQAIEDTVIAAIGSNTAGDTLVGETILAGHVWYMKITEITLTSGAVFVHRHNN